MMNGTDADGDAQQVTQELHDAAIRTTADQRQPDDHLAQPCLGDRQFEHHLIVRSGRQESVIQRRARLVSLLVDELAADPVPSRQIADRCRSRQRLNGQVPPVSFRQQRRGANASIHLAPTNLEKSGCYHLPWQRQLGCACDPDLNHAVLWWRTSTRGCATTSRCAAIWAARISICCGSS